MHVFDLPEAVIKRARSLGAPGETWLTKLPEVVNELAGTWGFTVGNVLAGGSEALVVETRREGEPAILKVGLPGSADLATEARVYRAAAGRGYATLLAHSATHDALLLERLGQPLAQRGVDAVAELERLCETLNAAWQTPPDALRGMLMTGAEKSRWLIDFIDSTWREQGEPCPRAPIDRAIAYAELREAAHSASEHVLVHGDAHALNALTVPDDPDRFRFVDPDALIAERACDLAVPMRENNRELLEGDTAKDALARCGRLARLGGSSEDAVWQWGFVERVSTGLVHFVIDMADEGLPYLHVAERLCDVKP